jgi:uncharacterized membrane protein YhaH (DUF805 family)
MFQNTFSFDGRIRRLEYGLSNLIYFFAILSITFILDLNGWTGQPIGSFITVCAYIPAIWFMLAQGAKRCHDRGNSGIWQIIPFYGLWMLFADGDLGRNEYGANPKGLNYNQWDEGKDNLKNPKAF